MTCRRRPRPREGAAKPGPTQEWKELLLLPEHSRGFSPHFVLFSHFFFNVCKRENLHNPLDQFPRERETSNGKSQLTQSRRFCSRAACARGLCAEPGGPSDPGLSLGPGGASDRPRPTFRTFGVSTNHQEGWCLRGTQTVGDALFLSSPQTAISAASRESYTVSE